MLVYRPLISRLPRRPSEVDLAALLPAEEDVGGAEPQRRRGEEKQEGVGHQGVVESEDVGLHEGEGERRQKLEPRGEEPEIQSGSYPSLGGGSPRGSPLPCRGFSAKPGAGPGSQCQDSSSDQRTDTAAGGKTNPGGSTASLLNTVTEHCEVSAGFDSDHYHHQHQQQAQLQGPPKPALPRHRRHTSRRGRTRRRGAVERVEDPFEPWCAFCRFVQQCAETERMAEAAGAVESKDGLGWPETDSAEEAACSPADGGASSPPRRRQRKRRSRLRRSLTFSVPGADFGRHWRKVFSHEEDGRRGGREDQGTARIPGRTVQLQDQGEGPGSSSDDSDGEVDDRREMDDDGARTNTVSPSTSTSTSTGRGHLNNHPVTPIGAKTESRSPTPASQVTSPSCTPSTNSALTLRRVSERTGTSGRAEKAPAYREWTHDPSWSSASTEVFGSGSFGGQDHRLYSALSPFYHRLHKDQWQFVMEGGMNAVFRFCDQSEVDGGLLGGDEAALENKEDRRIQRACAGGLGDVEGGSGQGASVWMHGSSAWATRQAAERAGTGARSSVWHGQVLRLSKAGKRRGAHPYSLSLAFLRHQLLPLLLQDDPAHRAVLVPGTPPQPRRACVETREEEVECSAGTQRLRPDPSASPSAPPSASCSLCSTAEGRLEKRRGRRRGAVSPRGAHGDGVEAELAEDLEAEPGLGAGQPVLSMESRLNASLSARYTAAGVVVPVAPSFLAEMDRERLRDACREPHRRGQRLLLEAREAMLLPDWNCPDPRLARLMHDYCGGERRGGGEDGGRQERVRELPSGGGGEGADRRDGRDGRQGGEGAGAGRDGRGEGRARKTGRTNMEQAGAGEAAQEEEERQQGYRDEEERRPSAAEDQESEAEQEPAIGPDVVRGAGLPGRGPWDLPAHLCVEIKPKWGSIYPPRAPTLAPRIKRRLCRFCEHQYLKLEQGKVRRRSGYCPLDLFSTSEARVQSALHRLVEEPQNNLRVFVNGQLAFDRRVAERYQKMHRHEPSSPASAAASAAAAAATAGGGGGEKRGRTTGERTRTEGMGGEGGANGRVCCTARGGACHEVAGSASSGWQTNARLLGEVLVKNGCFVAQPTPRAPRARRTGDHPTHSHRVDDKNTARGSAVLGRRPCRDQEKGKEKEENGIEKKKIQIEKRKQKEGPETSGTGVVRESEEEREGRERAASVSAGGESANTGGPTSTRTQTSVLSTKVARRAAAPTPQAASLSVPGEDDQESVAPDSLLASMEADASDAQVRRVEWVERRVEVAERRSAEMLSSVGVQRGVEVEVDRYVEAETSLDREMSVGRVRYVEVEKRVDMDLASTSQPTDEPQRRQDVLFVTKEEQDNGKAHGQKEDEEEQEEEEEGAGGNDAGDMRCASSHLQAADLLTQLLARLLCESEVLQDLQALQALDQWGVEAVWRWWRILRRAERGGEGAPRLCERHSSAAYEAALEKFLLSASAKDCSVLISLSPLPEAAAEPSHGTDGSASIADAGPAPAPASVPGSSPRSAPASAPASGPGSASPSGPHSTSRSDRPSGPRPGRARPLRSVLRGLPHISLGGFDCLYRIALVDLDQKPRSKLRHYYELDRRIVASAGRQRWAQQNNYCAAAVAAQAPGPPAGRPSPESR